MICAWPQHSLELQRPLSFLKNGDPEAGGNCVCYLITAYGQHLQPQGGGSGMVSYTNIQI